MNFRDGDVIRIRRRLMVCPQQGLTPILKRALSHIYLRGLSRPKSVYLCNYFVLVCVRVVLCGVHCGVLVFASGRS